MIARAKSQTSKTPKRRQKRPSTAAVSRPPLSVQDHHDVVEWQKRVAESPSPPTFRLENREGKEVLARNDADLPDSVLWEIRLGQTLGTTNLDSAHQLLEDLHKVVGRVAGPSTDGSTTTKINAALAQIGGIAPRDPLEGMLAVQMVGVHTAAMEHLSRSLTNNDTLVASQCVARASRLLRIFATQLDTLNRHRGKAPSEQRVVVEHVNINEGGQAIVGNVSALPRRPQGGGGITENA
jgi:hypothetical protein